ncbi:uncharacterized protein A4U43_C07F1350 [Asparagus officinalis]|uniref:Uncharacterized protein n=1 Tax=Asparagus officinalis TaxID=4686 RepID=A0A5P1E8P7_ASPOF|nr:uncharacterized protein A4U43_C07F1350 [Asparagus officinalis]
MKFSYQHLPHPLRHRSPPQPELGRDDVPTLSSGGGGDSPVATSGLIKLRIRADPGREHAHRIKSPPSTPPSPAKLASASRIANIVVESYNLGLPATRYLQRSETEALVPLQRQNGLVACDYRCNPLQLVLFLETAI